MWNGCVDFIDLKKDIKYLEKELEESRKKERPYINEIQRLRSCNRTSKIIIGQLEKKIDQLIKELEECQKNNIF